MSYEWKTAVGLIALCTVCILGGAAMSPVIFPAPTAEMIKLSERIKKLEDKAKFAWAPPGTWTNNTTPASYEGMMKWGTTNNEIMTLSLGISFQKDKEP